MVNCRRRVKENADSGVNLAGKALNFQCRGVKSCAMQQTKIMNPPILPVPARPGSQSMKKFLHLVGCLVKWTCLITGAGCLILMAFFALLLFAAILGGGKKSHVENKSVLVLDLGTGITDKPADENAAGALADLLGQGEHTVSLRAVTDSLRLAAKDPRIAALYLHGSVTPAMSPALPR